MKVILRGVLVVGLIAIRPALCKPPAVRDCWRGNTALENVALAWKPTEEIAVPAPKVIAITPGAAVGAESAAPAAVRIEVAALTDAREKPKRIGENREDVDHGCIYPVTTKDDAAAWTADGIRRLLKQLGLKVVDHEGDVIVSGELRQFFVTEGGTYDGEIGFRLDVVSKAGKPIWSGLIRGTNAHWGKSYRLANYHETLSDALIDAVKNLMADPGFARALGGDDSPAAKGDKP